MATRLEDEFDPTRINAPDAAYPAGSLKDETTPGVSDDGTPLASRVGNDWQGFSQSALEKAGIAANGQPDSVSNPQILQAIEQMYNDGDSQLAGGNIHPPTSQLGAQVGDTGLTNISILRDASTDPATLYITSEVVNGDVTALDFSAYTATIGGVTVDLYGITSSDGVLYASQFPRTRAGAQLAVDALKNNPDIQTLIFDGADYPADPTPLMIDSVGRRIVFQSPKFNFNVYFYRCLNALYQGHFDATGYDVRNIGLLKSTMPSFDCDFWYLQNYAGWGGVNFARFGNIIAKAAQVRQARLVSGLSSINDVLINKLECQGNIDSGPNLWGQYYNFWIRGARSNQPTAPVYTTDGTEGSLTGTDKWEDDITVSPFTVMDAECSYAPSGPGSYGVFNESSRPIYILSGFIEGHDRGSISGPALTPNQEDRNTSRYNVNGLYDVTAALSNTQKWGNYKKTLEPIWDNYEFKKADLTGLSTSFAGATGGFVNLPAGIPSYDAINGQSTGDRAIKIDNTGQALGARLRYTFVAKKTQRIHVVVRGIQLGQITIKSGAGNTQFALGYNSEDSPLNEIYSVGSSTVNKGDNVIVDVYTKGETGENTGDVAYITGFGVHYGLFGGTLYQEEPELTTASSSVTSTSSTDWNTFMTFTGTAKMITDVEFEFNATLVARGDIKGFYKATLINDGAGKLDIANSQEIVNLVGSSGATDVATLLRVQPGATGSIDFQVQKGAFGTEINAIRISDFRQRGAMTVSIV